MLGIGWLFEDIPEGQPTKEMLDVVVPDRPVYLDAFDLHSCWVNSKALEELGITDETPDPVGGKIVRDANGKATGHLLETATFNMVWPLVNNVDPSTADKYARAVCKAYNETGVTTAVDMSMEKAHMDTLRRAEANGELTIRVVAHWFMNRRPDPADELAQVHEAARLAQETADSPMFRVVGIKIITDGTIDACTAALLEPYTDGTNCDAIWDEESLERVVVEADKLGLQIALHAIGDKAVRSAINALETAAKVNGTTGKRHRIEHLEYTDLADIPRLAKLGITASMQPVHVDPALMATWSRNLGQPRCQHGFAWRSFLETGALLAFGTDTPTAPHMPLHNMYIANTRKSPMDPDAVPLGPHHALPLDESIIHGTADSAFACFMEDKVGKLKQGMLADLIVLDRDVLSGEPGGLLQAQVKMTLLGGRKVFVAS